MTAEQRPAKTGLVHRWRHGRRLPDDANEDRRGVLRGTGSWLAYQAVNRVIPAATLLAGAAATDKAYKNTWETIVDRPSPEIGWVKGHEERLATADSMVLCFAGIDIGTGENNANILAPALEALGPVGYIEYSTRGLKFEEIAKKIMAVQAEHPDIKKISVYGHSEGPLIFGGVAKEIEKLGGSIDIEYVFMDCTPPDISYTASFYPHVAPPVTVANDKFGGSSILTTVYNAVIHGGDPYDWDAPTPSLLKDQMNVLIDGTKYLQMLADAVDDESRLVLLRPKDLDKDDLVNERRSEPALRGFLPTMHTYELEGDDQGHANPDKNKDYIKKIAQAIEDLGRRKPKI